MKFVIDESFQKNNFGLFCVYFDSHKIYFPSNDWDDFFVAIIIDWCTELLNCKSSEKAEFNLLFMDGPYSLHISKIQNYCTITTMRNEEIVNPLLADVIPFDMFISMLLEMASTLIEQNDKLDEKDKGLLMKLFTK